MLKVFEFLQVGFCISDGLGRLIEADEAYVELLGLSGIDLEKVSYEGLTHPDDIPQASNFLSRVISNGMPHVFRKRSIRGDGEIVWVENRVSRLRGSLEKRILVACRPLDDVEVLAVDPPTEEIAPEAIAGYVGNLAEGLSKMSKAADLVLTSDILKLATKVVAVEAELNLGRALLQ